MNLPSSFLTASNFDRRREREEQKIKERESQKYNPREFERELNPYWKDGGNGLPKFQKPEESDEEERHYMKKEKYIKKSNWKKPTEIKNTRDVKIESDTELDEISEKELNLLGAKIIKAEIMGNIKLANELKEKLEKGRNLRNLKTESTQEDEILLTRTDSQGRSQPVKLQSDYGESSARKRKQKVGTHKDGERVRYFADDDKYSLKQMFENEKYNSVEDHNREFINMTKKMRKHEDLDEIFSDNIRMKESNSKVDSRNRDRAIWEHQKMSRSLDSCNKCIQSEIMVKHLLVSMGETVYLALPTYEPLTKGHCIIVPIRHVSCSTQLDENEWSDILNMRKSLVKMFQSKNEDVIFVECATAFHRFPHMSIECIPLPHAEGSMAPIYFKKAIDECEMEWAHNKKLISLKGKDVRKVIPKGLPYFSVSFTMDEGYAHVIEDEQLFPSNFAQEIIGGMLDLHHSKWRKPKRQSFEEQSKRVLEFSKYWKDFDCTA